MRFLRIPLGAAALVASAWAPTSAFANGRFPSAEQLVVSPVDPSFIAVQVTYGFIHSRNAGANWHWTCEQGALFTGSVAYDPPIGVMEDGTLIAGLFEGLIVSSPSGCDYTYAYGDINDRYVLDVSVDKKTPSRAIAITSNGLGMNKFDTRVWSTIDNADTWTQQGVALPDDFLALTCDAAPSDPNTLYLSGFHIVDAATYEGAIAKSVDGGATWQMMIIPGSDNESGPYLGAIDPVDANRIYVRLATKVEVGGKLLVSSDGGVAWSTIFEGKGKLLGFALSPDGTKVAVGGDMDGVWIAERDAYVFEQHATIKNRCLTWTPDALYACGWEFTDGFTIGRSTDEGRTFEAIHHLQCLDGPDPVCESGTSVADECISRWPVQQELIRTDT